MTSDHRKTHQLIWLGLAIVMPILLVLSILGIKEPAFTDSELIVKANVKNKQLVWEDETFTVYLDSENTLGSVQIFLKRPLRSPAPIVYATSSKNSGQAYLGKLDKKGVYNFEIDHTTDGIKIYDALKKEDLTNIKLPWD
ncbi:MAG: hypothetical protein WBG90_04255 [Saonia sp.]